MTKIEALKAAVANAEKEGRCYEFYYDARDSREYQWIIDARAEIAKHK